MNKQLRVWWIPQVGAGLTPFYQEVKTVQQGHELLKSLAQYDLYQYENNVKPDYSNAGGLQRMDADGDWVDWCDSEGSDLNDLENQYDSYDLTEYFDKYGVNGFSEASKQTEIDELKQRITILEIDVHIRDKMIDKALSKLDDVRNKGMDQSCYEAIKILKGEDDNFSPQEE